MERQQRSEELRDGVERRLFDDSASEADSATASEAFERSALRSVGSMGSWASDPRSYSTVDGYGCHVSPSNGYGPPTTKIRIATPESENLAKWHVWVPPSPTQIHGLPPGIMDYVQRKHRQEAEDQMLLQERQAMEASKQARQRALAEEKSLLYAARRSEPAREVRVVASVPPPPPPQKEPTRDRPATTVSTSSVPQQPQPPPQPAAPPPRGRPRTVPLASPVARQLVSRLVSETLEGSGEGWLGGGEGGNQDALGAEDQKLCLATMRESPLFAQCADAQLQALSKQLSRLGYQRLLHVVYHMQEAEEREQAAGLLV
jgi:hypothetical protein